MNSVLIVIICFGIVAAMSGGLLMQIWHRRARARADEKDQSAADIEATAQRVERKTRELEALPSRFQRELEDIRRGRVR